MNGERNFDADRQQLISFLSDTYNFVQKLYLEGVDPITEGSLVPLDLQPLLREAWNEFEENFNMEEAIGKINAVSEDRLIAFGLFGAQLELKLSIRDRLRDLWERIGGFDALKKLIDAIDTTLDSLLAATGINEALKELKDIFRGLLD